MQIVSVYDGDSIKADCDLGFKSSMNDLSLRIKGVDTPECRKSKSKGIGDLHVKAGKLVRDWLRELILNKWVTVKTYKDDTEKYGRWLSDIWLNGDSINEILIMYGFAKPYDGGTKSDWTDKELNTIIKKLS